MRGVRVRAFVSRLGPAVPGGGAARRVMMWETRSGRVWSDGPAIGATGVLHAVWPFGPMRPCDRLHDDAL